MLQHEHCLEELHMYRLYTQVHTVYCRGSLLNSSVIDKERVVGADHSRDTFNCMRSFDL